MKGCRRLLCLLLALCMAALSGCAVFKSETVEIGAEEAAPYLALTQRFLDALFVQDYNTCLAMFAENLQNTMDKEELQEQWDAVRLTYGDALEMDRYEAYRINGEGTILAMVTHKHGGSSVQLTFDESNAVAGLWFGMREDAVDYAVELPAGGVTEQEIVLGEGTDCELRAIITRPVMSATVPAVVLVQDSGAYDRNEAIGNCAPFADLAHGLAQRGIASIRFDKRTYTYGYDMTEEEINAMTVQQEVIDDALLALDALEQLGGIGDICLVGHGMGGALAPRIAQQSGGRIAGIVSLAGTARPYLDVVYEQTLAMTDDASRQSAIKKEYKKADKLESMKDSDTIFGVPVPYIRDLYDHPVAQSLAALDVPVFIAQGKDDFQTSLEDYKSWQSALEGYAGETRFALYDGLNHLFAENGGVKGRGTSAEYLAELHVSDQLLDDLADWVAQCTGK